MRKALPLLLAGLPLLAADFWQSKPYTQWTDKEVTKILTGSPWSRLVSVTLGESAMPGGRGGRGRGGGPPGGGADAAEPPRPGGDDLAGPGNVAPGGNVASREYGRDSVQFAPSLQLTVRWQSAMPVKQALVLRKYGSEASGSPDAKKFLDDNSTYLIAVSGLPGTIARTISPQIKLAIREQTALAVKGKPALQPSDIVVGPPGQQVEVFFVFQKTSPFTLADKDVEFSTNLGTIKLKQKFHLKDMAINGNLDL